jgi:O-antigen/teichoic acid export membrane protein
MYFGAVSRGDGVAARRHLRIGLFLTLAVCAASVCMLAAFRDEISGLLLGEAYRSGAYIMPILGAGLSFMSVSQVVNTVSLAESRSSCVLASEAGAAIVGIAAGIPLIASLGILGAALGTVLAYVTQLLFSLYFARTNALRVPDGGHSGTTRDESVADVGG